jgi:predicted RNase H-like nuclease
MDIYVGFDSAWTDKVPGAVCAVGIEHGRVNKFYSPRLAKFDEALKFIEEVRSQDGPTLIALDQPTVVKNLSGIRPVERVAASLISWLGGGVQPANRGKVGMFCDASPIWQFLGRLGATEDPELARTATGGLFLMEVFPALALASLDSGFFGRLSGPRYNPARKTFRATDWSRVAESAARSARSLGCEELASWCRETSSVAKPRKPDQDLLDSALCVIIALRWRLLPRISSILLGDLASGYMVAPATEQVRARLTAAARRHSVAIDGEVYTKALLLLEDPKRSFD